MSGACQTPKKLTFATTCNHFRMATASSFTPAQVKQTPVNTYFKPLVALILFVGAFLRLFHYLSNRSLYTDEAYLANNFLYRDYGQLTQPLDASQHAPLFFLWVTKTNQLLLGNHEFAFRLFPLLCGLAALAGFLVMLRKYDLGETGIIAGLALFALAYPLVYYSSEFKQYSTELLTTVLAYLLYARYKTETRLVPLAGYALAGAVMVWFSYPIIFILFSIALVHLLTLAWRREWQSVFRFTPVYAVWGLSFLLNLVLIINRNSLQDNALRTMWLEAFMPLPVRSVGDLKWFGVTFFTLFDAPLNLNWTFLNEWVSHRITFSFLGLISLLAGVMYIFRTQRHFFWMLVLPVVLALLASGLQKYPFTERFLLFLVPNFFFLIAAGVERIAGYLRPKLGVVAAGLVLILVIAPAGITAANGLLHEEQFGGWKRREVKAVVSYLRRHRKPGEKIFVNETASAFFFYNHVSGLNWPVQTPRLPETEEHANRSFHASFAPSVQGQTFWVVVAGDLHDSPDKGDQANHRDYFISYFTKHFQKIEEYRVKGVYTARFGPTVK